jgi:hypothetical protein
MVQVIWTTIKNKLKTYLMGGKFLNPNTGEWDINSVKERTIKIVNFAL